MYGKVFRSIFSGSLHGHWEAIITMQQFIVLADARGEVDMTLDAIAATTSIPRDLLERGIAVLEQPDVYTRTPGSEGRRLERLSPSRPWGWRLVNYALYRTISSEESRRELARERQRAHRERVANGEVEPPVTLRHAASRDVRMSRQAEAEEEVEEKTETPQGRRAARAFSVRLLTSGSPPVGGGPAALPLSDRKHEAVLGQATLDECRALYPGVEVERCLRQMRGWLIAHPNKRKTERGVLAFVHAWLGREQNGFGRGGPTTTSAPIRDADASYLASDREGRHD